MCLVVLAFPNKLEDSYRYDNGGRLMNLSSYFHFRTREAYWQMKNANSIPVSSLSNLGNEGARGCPFRERIASAE